jgi:hypothetical protein
MRGRVFGVTLVVSALLALGASGCSSSSDSLPSTAATAPTEIGHHVVLDASKLPTGAKASILSDVKLPGTGAVTALSATYQLTPSGQLAVPTNVTLPLSRPAPTGDEILVATKEKASDPWSYLPGRLTADRRSVTFQTNHFSIFGDIGISVAALASAFKTKFLDVIDSGMSASFQQPSCTGEATARSDGFSIASTSGSQVYWCFGMSGSQRILKFVNNSQYPMELAHPDMSVSSQGGLQGAASSIQNLLNSYGGSYAIVHPGDQVTFNVNVPVNTIGGVQTAADMFGEDLYALDVGLSTLAYIVTDFGLAELKGGVELLDTVVGVGTCESALNQGPSAVLTGCFDAKELALVFGDVLGVVLSLVVAYTSVVQFFRSEVDVARDLLTGKDHYTIAITRKAVGGGTVSSALPPTTSAPPSQGGQPATATASNSNGQLQVQLANFPLGTTHYFCHSGTGYPSGGSIASNGSVDITSANENLGALCSGSGNFWIGFQGTDGHDYYSNQVTLAAASPPAATATASGSQLVVQLANFPLGTTYYFCHSGTGYPTGGSIASHSSVDITSPDQNLGALCSGSGNFWIGFQGTDGHDYYSNQVTLG